MITSAKPLMTALALAVATPALATDFGGDIH